MNKRSAVLRDFLLEVTDATPEEVDAVFTTRGKRKGYLKKTCPGPGKPGRILWCAIMSNLNPQLIPAWSIMMESGSRRFLELEKQLGEVSSLKWHLINQTGQQRAEFNRYFLKYARLDDDRLEQLFDRATVCEF
jgi:hypothetical protein